MNPRRYDHPRRVYHRIDRRRRGLRLYFISHSRPLRDRLDFFLDRLYKTMADAYGVIPRAHIGSLPVVIFPELNLLNGWDPSRWQKGRQNERDNLPMA